MNRMKAGADCENARDMWQYYGRNGVFGLKKTATGPYYPAYIHDLVEGGQFAVRLARDSLDGVDVKIYDFKTISSMGVFGVPMLGNVEYADSFFYISKETRREAHKGIRLDALHYYSPDAQYGGRYNFNRSLGLTRGNRDYNMTFPVVVQTDLKLLYNILNPHFFSFYDGIGVLDEGVKIGVCLTPDIGMYLKRGSKEIHLSFKNLWDIATVDTTHERSLRIKVTDKRHEMLLPLFERLTHGDS